MPRVLHAKPRGHQPHTEDTQMTVKIVATNEQASPAGKLADAELMLACVVAYNDFLLEWISPDPRRFIPICAMPFWDVEASVRENSSGV